MDVTCVASALHQLSEIETCLQELYFIQREVSYEIRHQVESCIGYLDWNSDRNGFTEIYTYEAYLQVQHFRRELMFLKMMFWCFATWDNTDANQRCMFTTLESIWEDLEERIDDSILTKTELGNQDWDLFALFLTDTIQQCKSLALEHWHAYSDSSLKFKALPSDQTLQFIQLLLQNLELLVSDKDYNVTPPLKKQIDSLKLRLALSRNFFRLITAHQGINCEELRILMLCLQTFANDAASLAFLFWSKAENVTFETNQMFKDMRQKIIEFCGYLSSLKAIKLKKSSDDSVLYEQVIQSFVDLHLENIVDVSKDDKRIVSEVLTFLLSFVSDPPEGCEQDEQLASVCTEIDLLFTKCMYLILSPRDIMKEHFTMDKMLLNDLGEKLDETMEKVKQLYVKRIDSSSYNFPRTNGLGFYYFLLENLESLQEKLGIDMTFIPFAKNYIIEIEKELLSMRPLVDGIFELQKEQKEFEETWLQLINLAYHIEHVINSCHVRIHPIWYNMTSLYDILHQIQDVKRMLEKVDTSGMHYTKFVPYLLESSSTRPERMQFFTNCEEGISLKKETNKVIDDLVGGYESLGIVSIIGMAGLGKTTLAKKVCNSETVRRHFHILALGSVSRFLNKRNFFIEILCEINTFKKDKFNSMTEDDLAHHLWRCLSGQTYLVVVDDIWDVKAWDALKSSFPDDKNGSRVIFTTRELKVALDARSSCHNLRPLFDDESFMLLQMRVFGKDDSPPIFSELGKVIAKNCNGLPLSIVVVAGLLTRKKTSLNWWKEIAEATSQFVGQECREIIGYSYKHLPEHLKSCFLYMGIYGEDELIEAKKVRQLWIGEGFVKKSMTECLRTVAKKYLRDLVDKNLVTPVKSTVGGGIRTCRLHDLIRDFCRWQMEEDNFVCLRDGYVASNPSNSTMCNQYRVSIQGPFDGVEPAVLENIHSLVCKGKTGIRKSFMEKLKLVQVLHLEEEAESIDFNDLVHLRYLYVRRWQGKVPESVCDHLWNLETFIIESYDVGKLPKTIWRMKKLRHLEIPCQLEVDDDHDEGCLHSLDNLEFLSELYLFDDRTARVILRRLPKIQKLTCTLAGSIWNSNVFSIDFLDQLESLTLRSYEADTHVSFPLTLRRVYYLGDDNSPEDLLSALGELPLLEVLKLEANYERWEVEDGQFQNLKCLMVELDALEEWNVSFDSFSRLERLEFFRCAYLEEIPACFAECSTLQMIQIEFCNEELVSSAVQVVEEQKDNGNEVQLFYK